MLGCGYFVYNSFGVILPELDDAESYLVVVQSKPLKPFLLQNFGIAFGYALWAAFAFVDLQLNLPW